MGGLRETLLSRLIMEHGPAGRLTLPLNLRERYLRQAHSTDEMVPIDRRLLAS
jgi:hypothetical protein